MGGFNNIDSLGNINRLWNGSSPRAKGWALPRRRTSRRGIFTVRDGPPLTSHRQVKFPHELPCFRFGGKGVGGDGLYAQSGSDRSGGCRPQWRWPPVVLECL